MTGNIPVNVKIPTESWPGLSARADMEGYSSVTAYAKALLIDIATVTNNDDMILFWHRQGLTNKQIAERTGQTIAKIRSVCLAAGKHSNGGAQ